MNPSNRPGSTATTIDWKAIHARLESVRQRLQDTDMPNSDQTREILNARARRLACVPAAAGAHAAAVEIVEFTLAQERYAVEARHVAEVSPLYELAPLPGTPVYVRGIVHLRGQMLAVIDLKRFFELPAKGLTNLDRIIVLRGPDMEFGVLADCVIGTRSLVLAELQPALPTLTGIRAEYLLGLGPEQLIVLDADRLLADPGIVVNDQKHIPK